MRRPIRAVAALVVGVVLVATGCSKEPTPGADGGPGSESGPSGPTAELPFDGSPAADEVAEVAGLVWPPSMSGYRSVRLDAGELDVTFRLPNDEVAAFVEASRLGRLQPGRVIVDQHLSPLWEDNPPEGSTVAWAESTRDGIERRVEVVTPAGSDPVEGEATVRLAIVATDD